MTPPNPPPTVDSAEAAQPPAPTGKRPLKKRVRRWILEALVVGLVYVAFSQFQTRELLSVGQPAPALQLKDTTGRAVSLSDFKGKTVLLHFWATWCGVCVREFPMLKDFQSSLDDDTVLLTVVEDGDNPKLPDFLAKNNIHYPVLLGTADLIRRFKVNAFPTNYFVDPDGIVRGHSVGLSTSWALNARLGCAR